MSVFVTGADTGVGKTVISAWIALHMGWSYFKPIQTGVEDETSDSVFAASLGLEVYPEHYRLRLSLSPYVAAQKEGVLIDTAKLTRLPLAKKLVVEGLGGVMVPITVNFDIIDLIKVLKLPVILVVTATLGTINHSRLTLQMLKLRGIKVLGVVMVGENLDNKNAIEFFSGVKVLCQFPLLKSVDASSLKKVRMDAYLRSLLIQSDASHSR